MNKPIYEKILDFFNRPVIWWKSRNEKKKAQEMIDRIEKENNIDLTLDGEG